MREQSLGEAELRQALVDACRILIANGCTHEIYGDVSIRNPRDGAILTATCELPAGDGVPEELALHEAIYCRRPDAGAVVHAHAPLAPLCAMLDLALQPIVASYDTWTLEVAEHGIPIFPHSVAIDTPALAAELADVMGTADVCILAGHGIVAVGADLPLAVVRALKLETLAEITLQAHTAGRAPQPLSLEEITEKMKPWRPHAQTYARWIWDFHRRKLGAA